MSAVRIARGVGKPRLATGELRAERIRETTVIEIFPQCPAGEQSGLRRNALLARLQSSSHQFVRIYSIVCEKRECRRHGRVGRRGLFQRR
jgi:hypothetical protein